MGYVCAGRESIMRNLCKSLFAVLLLGVCADSRLDASPS